MVGDAQHKFWECVEDVGEWAIHQLAEHGSIEAAAGKALGIASVTANAMKAVSRAHRGDWRGAAESSVDMANSALNVATVGAYGIAKAVVIDMAATAYAAAGLGEAETINEITARALPDLGERLGDALFEARTTPVQRGEESAPQQSVDEKRPARSERESRQPEPIFTLESRSFVPFDQFGGGFAGDSRGFSMEADASARVHAFATLVPATGGVISKHAYSDTSFGPQMLVGSRGASNSIPEITVEGSQLADGGSQYSMSASGSNPLVVGAPDIDNHADLTVTLKGNILRVEGTLSGDRFPASEWALRDGAGTAAMVGGHMPEKASDVWTKLFGDTRRPIGKVKLEIEVDREGAFKNIRSAEFKAPDGRTITGMSGASISQWNKSLSESLTPTGMPSPQVNLMMGEKLGRTMQFVGNDQ